MALMDDELKVLRAVAALRGRGDEATAAKVASEAGLPEGTAVAFLDRLFRRSLVAYGPVTEWPTAAAGPPHVKLYSITEQGIGALDK